MALGVVQFLLTLTFSREINTCLVAYLKYIDGNFILCFKARAAQSEGIFNVMFIIIFMVQF